MAEYVPRKSIQCKYNAWNINKTTRCVGVLVSLNRILLALRFLLLLHRGIIAVYVGADRWKINNIIYNRLRFDRRLRWRQTNEMKTINLMEYVMGFARSPQPLLGSWRCFLGSNTRNWRIVTFYSHEMGNYTVHMDDKEPKKTRQRKLVELWAKETLLHFRYIAQHKQIKLYQNCIN